MGANHDGVNRCGGFYAEVAQPAAGWPGLLIAGVAIVVALVMAIAPFPAKEPGLAAGIVAGGLLVSVLVLWLGLHAMYSSAGRLAPGALSLYSSACPY